MVPIYEQGMGRGIGHSVDTFRKRFSDICREHIRDQRAKAFAFIFYDFNDDTIRGVLEHEGAVTQLDRLSGHDLSLFFLHSPSSRTAEEFNRHFLVTLGVPDVTMPCVVLFRLAGQELEDIEVIELDHVDYVTAFHELYVIVERYIHGLQPPPSAFTRMKSVFGHIGVHVFDDLLDKLLDHLV